MITNVQTDSMFCVNCGTPLPVDARFCLRCGAPAAAGNFGRPEPPDEPTIQIRLWRGYVKAEFYVELEDPDTGGARVERSRPFRWRRDEPPPAEREDVGDAYADLVARLVALGWEQVGTRSPWYAQRFRRRDDRLQAVDEGGSTGGRLREVSQEAP